MELSIMTVWVTNERPALLFDDVAAHEFLNNDPHTSPQ